MSPQSLTVAAVCWLHLCPRLANAELRCTHSAEVQKRVLLLLTERQKVKSRLVLRHDLRHSPLPLLVWLLSSPSITGKDLLNQNAGQAVGNVHTAKVPEVKQAEASVPGPVGTRRSSPPRRAVADLLWWRDSSSGGHESNIEVLAGQHSFWKLQRRIHPLAFCNFRGCLHYVDDGSSSIFKAYHGDLLLLHYIFFPCSWPSSLPQALSSWHLCPFDKTRVWQPSYFLTQDAPESSSLLRGLQIWCSRPRLCASLGWLGCKFLAWCY
ncbi:uncharacterized protein LOC130541898 [Ursus arctos]|uniref:uncharacterized protein LOC130541898 n=1 Tax=Ursus arctos TaxID=9644 RepID=UPI00254922C2|nr:uncharacterized protein LOC130541898 [Ursus arctos]